MPADGPFVDEEYSLAAKLSNTGGLGEPT